MANNDNDTDNEKNKNKDKINTTTTPTATTTAITNKQDPQDTAAGPQISIIHLIWMSNHI